MVRTFLKVYMELSSYFLFLQEQIKDIIISRYHHCMYRVGARGHAIGHAIYVGAIRVFGHDIHAGAIRVFELGRCGDGCGTFRLLALFLMA